VIAANNESAADRAPSSVECRPCPFRSAERQGAPRSSVHAARSRGHSPLILGHGPMSTVHGCLRSTGVYGQHLPSRLKNLLCASLPFRVFCDMPAILYLQLRSHTMSWSDVYGPRMSTVHGCLRSTDVYGPRMSTVHGCLRSTPPVAAEKFIMSFASVQSFLRHACNSLFGVALVLRSHTMSWSDVHGCLRSTGVYGCPRSTGVYGPRSVWPLLPTRLKNLFLCFSSLFRVFFALLYWSALSY
jgi:hypothetical protein